jgi:hypothetical protein
MKYNKGDRSMSEFVETPKTELKEAVSNDKSLYKHIG